MLAPAWLVRRALCGVGRPSWAARVCGPAVTAVCWRRVWAVYLHRRCVCSVGRCNVHECMVTVSIHADSLRARTDARTPKLSQHTRTATHDLSACPHYVHAIAAVRGVRQGRGGSLRREWAPVSCNGCGHAARRVSVISSSTVAEMDDNTGWSTVQRACHQMGIVLLNSSARAGTARRASRE